MITPTASDAPIANVTLNGFSGGSATPAYFSSLTGNSVAKNNSFATNGIIDFTLSFDNATEGYALLSFEVPIVAINEAAKGDYWYIRGGLNQTLEPDLGSDANSTGENILIRIVVGNSLIVNQPTTP